MRRDYSYGYPTCRPRRRRGPLVLGVLGFVLVAALAVGMGVLYVGTDRYITCTVTDKDRTTKTDSEGNNSSDARVYTKECSTLQVADSTLFWHFNSSDTYASIEPGHRYRFRVVGWRVGFFSMFPNILEVHDA